MVEHTIFIPVILSGGTGTRLWPVSRESHPKPFIKLADNLSLLQKTFLRASQLPHTHEIITITNKEYYLKSKAEYEKIHVAKPTSCHFLLEPFARNTASAIAFAALKVAATHGADAILLALPADHLIEDTVAFTRYCEKAIALAQMNKIITFGIKPTSAHTGFGYIECGNTYADADSYHVSRFVEKPDAATAETYIKSNNYFWNAGMFCFKTSIILQELSMHAPDVLKSVEACWEISQKNNRTASVFELDAASFADLIDISIDYAVMEKSKEIVTLTCDFEWHDIGSWDAYKKLHHSDENGNTILGDAILIDSQDNFIHSEGRMVASIGINNLAIIDTPDALLITHRDRAQDVKQVVQTLKHQAHDSYLTHRTVIRPWGSYTVLEEGPSFKIKRIVVNPGCSLSLQSHQHRSEHWVVVEGEAKVVNADKEYFLKKNESTFVPMQTLHRLSNPGNSDLVIIEVQTGHYLGEDDILRIEDTYGRVT